MDYRLLQLIVNTIIIIIITPWSRVLLPKLSGSQLVKKFPTFYGTRMIITAFTSARHLSVTWVRSNQSMLLPSPFLNIHFNTNPLFYSWYSKWYSLSGPGSSAGIATDYGLGDPGSNPGGDEIFCPSRPTLRPTQPPVKWVPVFSRV